MIWEEIEKEFIKWDKKGKFTASQRGILNWFKDKFEQERAEAFSSGYDAKDNPYLLANDELDKTVAARKAGRW
ncbi:hypothetical protein LCGC14_2877250 [marine sediment metagenome]|uniref:Uncharacterized protein n=1 Tax=marine sediment metagenome TaxID=412755 RepID=A0A0F9A990_9ZZZZ